MALALPSGSVPGTPKKDKKRPRPRPKDKKKDDKELDSDVELEVSAEDLVGEEEGDGDADVDPDIDADAPERRVKRRRDEEEEDEVSAATTAAVGADIKREAQRRRHEILLFRGALDEEQGKRFDAFHSSVIPKGVIKKVNKDLYDQNVPNNVTSVVAGMVKVFVADVVETAREIQKYTDDADGPLRPYHLQMARMRLQEQGIIAAPTGAASSRTSTGLRARRTLFRR